MTSQIPGTSTGPDRHHGDLPDELPANAGRAATGILIVLMAQLMLVLDATVVNVALPRIDSDLGFGPASLSISGCRILTAPPTVPLATVVIGGIISSTVLSLLVLPGLYRMVWRPNARPLPTVAVAKESPA